MKEDCTHLQAAQEQTLTMSGKVVGDDKKPEFPKQSQEFIGTVRSHWDYEHMQTFKSMLCSNSFDCNMATISGTTHRPQARLWV